MGLAQSRVNRQVRLLLKDKSLNSLEDLLPETEWKLLETVCYEAGRRADNLCYIDLKRPIAQWMNKSWMDLVGYLYAQESIAKRNLVDYVANHLMENNFRIPSLNRYRIFKAQIKECKREKKIDFALILPETIREMYKLMCEAADTLPMDVNKNTFSVTIPKLDKSLLDLGFLDWYKKEKSYSNIQEALQGMKRDPELNIKEIGREMTKEKIKEKKRETLLKIIEQYKKLNWKQELVVSEKSRAESMKNAKKSRIYRQFKDVPNFRQIDWGEGECEVLVKAWRNRGDSYAYKRLVERYSRMVAEKALGFVGMGVDYTRLVKFNIKALHEIIDEFDFEGGENFPVFFALKVRTLLRGTVYRAKIAATSVLESIAEKPKTKYEECLLEFLYDFENALKNYELELKSELPSKVPALRQEFIILPYKRKTLRLAAERNYSETYSKRKGKQNEYKNKVAEVAIRFVGKGVGYKELVECVIANTYPKEIRSLEDRELYSLIDKKIRFTIRAAKNSLIKDSIEPLMENIIDLISALEVKGLTPKSEKRIDCILDFLGKIKPSYEYCTRAYYGLGDTRYNLQFGRRQRLKEITKAEISGKGEEKENVRQKIQGGFRSMVKVYMQNLN